MILVKTAYSINYKTSIIKNKKVLKIKIIKILKHLNNWQISQLKTKEEGKERTNWIKTNKTPEKKLRKSNKEKALKKIKEKV